MASKKNKKTRAARKVKKAAKKVAKRGSKKLIVANWKMNPENIAEAQRIFRGIKRAAADLSKTRTVVCPPFVYLSQLKGDETVEIGAQNIFTEEAGSYTGEISARMVKGLGATYTILGHSERRARGETDEMVAKKVERAIAEGLTVILCVGEQKRTESGEYLDFVKNQLMVAVGKVASKDLKRIVIAYEPVWAIGKSEADAMQPHQIHEMKIFIYRVLNDMYKSRGGTPLVQKVPILYGGSVTSRIAGGILNQGTVDGLLVGRQSLDPVEFGAILKLADEAK